MEFGAGARGGMGGEDFMPWVFLRARGCKLEDYDIIPL